MIFIYIEIFFRNYRSPIKFIFNNKKNLSIDNNKE